MKQYMIVLETIVAGFERRFHQWMMELDGQLGVSSPAAGDLKKLTEGVPLSPMILGYFFAGLSHPKWLAPLRKKPFFDHPAPVERDESGGRWSVLPLASGQLSRPWLRELAGDGSSVLEPGGLPRPWRAR
jgi:hypothetical protein